MLKVLLSAFICTIGDLWERSGTRSAPKFPLLALKWVGGKSVLNCISDAHISKTKAVVCALAICVCSLLAAGATQTASAQTTILKTAHRGLEVGAFQTPAEIDCQNRSSAENGCSDETFCA